MLPYWAPCLGSFSPLTLSPPFPTQDLSFISLPLFISVPYSKALGISPRPCTEKAALPQAANTWSMQQAGMFKTGSFGVWTTRLSNYKAPYIQTISPGCNRLSILTSNALTCSGQTFSVKGQIVNILGFARHIQSLLHILYIFGFFYNSV